MTPGHPLVQLWARLERGEAVVAGVLSGTSADGIDVALLRADGDGPRELLAHATVPFPPALGRAVRAALDGAPLSPREVALLSRDLGVAFGAAARARADLAGLPLDLVGSHGQTVYHHDGVEPAGAATLQLGDGDFVAHAARAPVVSDFRTADLAAGGEGAPLAGLVDPALFARVPRPCAILNLGGMANVTLLADASPALAFDTGPANALLDGLARALLRREYDRDGASAAAGRASPQLLAELGAHPFFDRAPPKSTGRDTFGAAYVADVLARVRALGLGAEDALATGVELVATSVGRALERWLPQRPRELVLCGGGAHNRALVRALERATGLAATPSDAHGVPADAREACLFAHLAVRCVLARPSTAPGVTGARAGAVLGKLSLPLLEPGAPPGGDGRAATPRLP